MTSIILLQGVMPTGKNKLPMAQLRVTVLKAGCADAQTWIQSGNLLPGPDPASPSKRLKRYKKRRTKIPEMLFICRKRRAIKTASKRAAFLPFLFTSR